MNKLWTDVEDDIVRLNYKSMSPKELMELLPGRTEDAIRVRARHLGVKRDIQWTKEEDEILAKYYSTMGSKVSSMLPRHTPQACTDRANKSGLKYIRKWTKEEDDIIRKNYSSIGRTRVSKMLVGRSPAACYERAKILGVSRKWVKESSWTEGEDKVLRRFYPIMGPDVCFKIPNRDRESCAKRARRLGLKKGRY